MKQATIRETLSFAGKGLHTGVEIHATLYPAPENTGIRICRTDMDGQPEYEALADYVTQTRRGTVLENGKWRVSTVEHLLSALYALGVTNCRIAVDAPEVPILDGSAKPYIEAIGRLGIETQEAEAKEWIVTEPVTFDSGKGNTLTILPADEYAAEVTIDFNSPVLPRQTAVLEHLSDYAEQISRARTFCFLREIELLLHLGLIKGGDMQNALVIYDKKVSQWSMNRMSDRLGQERIDASQLGYLTPLKYDNEPARHKLLDLIGDLALMGCRIRGRLVAEKPGHGFNTDCCKQLRQKYKQ